MERRFANEVITGLLEHFFFTPELRGFVDRENHERLVFESLTRASKADGTEFVLSVRDRRSRTRRGTARVEVANPLPEALRDPDGAADLVSTFVLELSEDLVSQEPPPGVAMNVLSWA